MSMDDISQDDYYGTPKPTPMRRPATSRSRDRMMGGNRIVSVEQLHHEVSQYGGGSTGTSSPAKLKYQHPEDIR